MALSVLALLLLGGYGLLEAQERRASSFKRPKARETTSSKSKQKLWFFFSTSQKGLEKEVARLRTFVKSFPEIAFRPCLLVEDFGAIKKPTTDFAATLRELGKLSGPGFYIPVWDAEGLRFAQTLGIRRVPAYALVTDAGRSGFSREETTHRAHVAIGRGVNLKELVTCRSHR